MCRVGGCEDCIPAKNYRMLVGTMKTKSGDGEPNSNLSCLHVLLISSTGIHDTSNVRSIFQSFFSLFRCCCRVRVEVSFMDVTGAAVVVV